MLSRIISIGKYGTFSANLLIGRPYHLTFELTEGEDAQTQTQLRIVPAAELHAETLTHDTATPAESRDERTDTPDGVEYDIVGDNGEVLMRSNRLTVDDTSRQAMSMEEIEELKRAGTGSGKDIIAKIMASHMALDEKTSFSLAKYTLRKSKKYMRRFTVLPMDVSMLTEVMLEKEPHRIMELREEALGLIGNWANVHYGAPSGSTDISHAGLGNGRWLVVDDTGGLVVAALAERMGVLYPKEDEEGASDSESSTMPFARSQQETTEAPSDPIDQEFNAVIVRNEHPTSDVAASHAPPTDKDQTREQPPLDTNKLATPSKLPRHHLIPAMSAPNNTLTVLHANAQPNLGLLKYFSFDTNAPPPSHPLYTHLKTLSWLQLLHPTEDAGYAEPETVPDSVLQTWKSGKRGTYYRKRRRWEKIRGVVDEARAGGFDGIVIASAMEPATILRHAIPLLRGAAQVVVYSPTVEPLTELMDLYSRDRRAAYVQQAAESKDEASLLEDFPVNPTLLLAPMLQTARVRNWQVLPGRTHPHMTSKGGAEGFLFTATRVLPVEGKVEARGKFAKRRRVETNGT